jgi:hypothetical protein
MIEKKSMKKTSMISMTQTTEQLIQRPSWPPKLDRSISICKRGHIASSEGTSPNQPHAEALIPKGATGRPFPLPLYLEQVPEARHLHCWPGSPRWISGSGLCRISRVWPGQSYSNSNRQGSGGSGALASSSHGCTPPAQPSAWPRL